MRALVMRRVSVTEFGDDRRLDARQARLTPFDGSEYERLAFPAVDDLLHPKIDRVRKAHPLRWLGKQVETLDLFHDRRRRRIRDSLLTVGVERTYFVRAPRLQLVVGITHPP